MPTIISRLSPIILTYAGITTKRFEKKPNTVIVKAPTTRPVIAPFLVLLR